MSKRAKRAALKAYPHFTAENITEVTNARHIFAKGYKQAEKDTIERACQLLYDYNKQMTEMFGAKAVLSCNQFTIDVERFRKTLIIEEE